MAGSRFHLLLLPGPAADLGQVQRLVEAHAPGVFTVEGAAGVDEVLARLHAPAPPDVVLLDLSAPGADRLIALVHASGAPHEAPALVALAGHEDEAAALDALRQGARAVVGRAALEGPRLVLALRQAAETAEMQRLLHAQQAALTVTAGALAASEERYRLAEQAVQGTVFDLDVRTGAVTRSEGLEMLIGVPIFETAPEGAWWVARVHPDDRALYEACFADALATGQQRYACHYRIRHADGTYRHVYDRALVVRDAHGQAVRVVGATHDETAQRTAQIALRASEDRLRRATAAGRIGTWEWSLPDDRLVWSDLLFALHGVDPATFGGRSADFQAILPEDERVRLGVAVAATLAGGSEYALVFRAQGPDGALRWFWTHASVLRDAAGVPVRMVGVTMDVHERHEAEEALRTSEEHLRLALDAARMGTWTWNIETNVRRRDARAAQITGMPPETDHPDLFRSLHPDDRGRTEAATRAALDPAGDGRLDQTMRFTSADGSVRHVQVAGQTYFEGEGEARRAVRMVGAVRDVTAEHAAAEALRTLNATLEARVAERTAALEVTLDTLAARNRELQDFAFAASHDLQEPLRKVRAFGDLLLQQHAGTLGEDARHALDRMVDGAARMSHQLSDLLAYTRVTTKARPFAPVDLAAVLAHVQEDLADRVQEAGAVVRVEGTLPFVEGDATQLHQLLLHLIGNALKFSRADVAPVVTVRATRESDGTATRVRLTVEDNGIGFAPKYAARIFGPFERLHPRGTYEGSGIGLAVCRRIVERHGGTIMAEGRPGQGAVFSVVLPPVQLRTLPAFAPAPEHDLAPPTHDPPW